ncbi:MAG: hypothetical protein K2P58_05965 [Hyphomonadaceae bacterium]|nr:hypothetical protein [Hyphomonadaceae bacterium]
MAKTIDELAKALRDAFDNPTVFETVLNAPETQALSKASVATLYSRVFRSEQPPSRSMTKPELFRAMKRERINYARGRA